MLLLKNHTQPEAILDLIGNKNKNVKVAFKLSKDTESFNSHAHDLDQGVKENCEIKTCILGFRENDLGFK